MPEKSPENIAWLTYLWVVGTACLGGTVSLIRKVKKGHASWADSNNLLKNLGVA